MHYPKMTSKQSYRFALLALLLLFMLPAKEASGREASGKAIFVTTTQDELNGDGDCSLREAVRSANLDSAVDACQAGSGFDTIVLGAGLYRLTITGTGEDNAQAGDLDLLEEVIILGKSAAETIIDGNQHDRVFHVNVVSGVQLVDLTIQNGAAPAEEADLYGGGGILNQNGTLEVQNAILSGNRAARTGGGLDNLSTAWLTNVTATGNSSEDGGAIFNSGTLNLNGVNLTDNTAANTGGGLDNQGDVTIINVTISGNSANLEGGGLFSDGYVTSLNVTIASNTTGVTNKAEIRFINTLVADSTVGDNCTGTGAFVSQGHNLDTGNTCKFNGPTDKSNSAALLGPLEDHGGNLWTHALLPGSPAIDQGGSLDCPLTDARGASRPADGNNDGQAVCDIGAHEQEAVFLSTVYLTLIVRR
jgi:CSLREA domain-containing protein